LRATSLAALAMTPMSGTCKVGGEHCRDGTELGGEHNNEHDSRERSRCIFIRNEYKIIIIVIIIIFGPSNNKKKEKKKTKILIGFIKLTI
jgi:hypothetical protein